MNAQSNETGQNAYPDTALPINPSLSILPKAIKHGQNRDRVNLQEFHLVNLLSD